jgi:hypothetical protein
MAAATIETNKAVAWGGMIVGGTMYNPFFGAGNVGHGLIFVK